MTVLLFHPVIAEEGKEFDRNHADRLLAMTDNGGWYEKTEDASNDSGNTGKARKTKAPKGDKVSD